MKKTLKYLFKEWVIPAAIAVVIVLFLYKFVFMLPTVPTGSMIPTIKVGDKLFVNELINADKLKRGDIVVFRPDWSKDDLVKRLIGLPGEKVVIDTEGNVYIDGELLKESYAVPDFGEEHVFEIPEDCFLFLGDNRPNSEDARYWDNPYVNKKFVKGKAEFVFFPFNQIRKLS